MNPLPVHERFNTWQGEGCHLGKAAYFIRLHGCPVKCSWCDSAGTWHPDHTPDDVEKADPEKLAEDAFASGCEIVVLTGGEPAIHDLIDLTHALRIRSLPVHIETCGAYPLLGEFDWITLSPKWDVLPLDENLAEAHELKIIVEDETSIEKWVTELADRYQKDQVWLHPEWSLLNDESRRAEGQKVLSRISEWVKEHGKPYRAGYHLHKVYEVDQQDPGSRPLVPLGGDPLQGI
ncbi:MAG: 7-carboxy-7-deazaguanine synthase QueE [Opitutales bacterium]